MNASKGDRLIVHGRVVGRQDQVVEIVDGDGFGRSQRPLGEVAKQRIAPLGKAARQSDREEHHSTAAIPAVEKKWADAQAEFAQFQEDAKARLERLRADQVESQAALVKAEATIPDKSRSTYEHLTKALGPDAFAPLKDRTCLSCRTGLNQQRVMEIQAGAFLLCPICGKMFYPAE